VLNSGGFSAGFHAANGGFALSSRPPKRTLRTPKRVRRFFRPQLEPLEDRVFPALLTVFSLLDNDGVNPAAFAGTGTLRQAIIDANANVGADVIQFQLPGSGTRVINVLSELPTITESVLIDGYTQAGSAVATANAAATLNVRINNAASSPINGLVIDGTDTAVRGLMITGFNQGEARGIDVYGSGHVIAGNFLGTDGTTSPSTVSQGNNYGIVLEWNAHDNRVGGTTPADRNIISGNRDGMWLYGGDNYNNVVEGNYIGLDRTGTLDFGNQWRGMVVAFGAHDNTIGGSTDASRNVISGNNDKGILFYGTGTQNNVVSGNYIGLNAAGSGAVGNGNAGVAIEAGASDNVIGGAADKPGTGLGNVISGNTDQGIWILNTGSERNRVEGNLIGLNPAGTAELRNGNIGIYIAGGASRNIIGGSTQGVRNIISGNSHGILVQDQGTDGNVVAGNYIGTDIAGTLRVQNNGAGIAVAWGAKDTLIGTDGDGVGDEFERNVISGSVWENILIVGLGTDRTVIAGNYIGLNAAGTAAMTNSAQGITVRYGAKNTRIGTDGSNDAFNANERNVISGNGWSGIVIQTPEWNGDLPADGSTTDGSWIAGNYLGTDATGTVAIQNNGDGVMVLSGATNTIIGTNSDGSNDAIEGNLIAGNRYQGVYLNNPLTTGTRIAGNRIGINSAGSPLGNDSGIWIDNAAQTTVGSNNDGLSDSLEGNTISGNRYYGVVISGANAAKNQVSRNALSGNALIGIDVGNDGASANDTGDGDTGPNSMQNAPVLSAPTGSGATRTVAGTLNSLANTSYRIEFFSNVFVDPAGDGEGKNYLGSVNVTTNASGNASFNYNYAFDAANPYITATATNLLTGETSEFSASYVRTFMVTNTNNFGPGSLQQAIFDANSAPNLGDIPDRIAFSLPGSGVRTISLLSVLYVTDPVFIDGYSQAGAVMATATTPATLAIRLDGTNASSAFAITTSNSTIRGFIISGCSTAGIDLNGAGAKNNVISGNYIGNDGTSARGNFYGVLIEAGANHNTIGGLLPSQRNVISGNSFQGVVIVNPGADFNVIQGNYIGLNAAGTTGLSNGQAGVGIFGGAKNNLIGGTAEGARNVFGANFGGVWITDPTSTGNDVIGNYIGTDATGKTPIGNGADGVSFSGSGGSIVSGNVIGSTSSGVIAYSGASNITIVGNRIGVAANGTALPNRSSGVYVLNSSNIRIGGLNSGEENLIWNTSGIGIRVEGSTGVAAYRNSIVGSAGLGIDLGSNGVTTNDPLDTDSGPNGFQNYPVISQANLGSDHVLRVSGALNSAPNRTYRIEVFANITIDGSGYGEGQRYLGTTTVVTDSAGNASFQIDYAGPLGSQFAISATATDVASASTSEFSQTVRVSFPATLGTYDDVVLRDAPNGYWRLNETSGTDAFDSSLNGNDGRFSGPSLHLGVAGIVPTVSAAATAFFGFANSPGAVVLPSAAFGFPTTTTQTFETWFKTTPGGSGVILGQVGGRDITPQRTGFSGHVPAVYIDATGVVRSELFWHGSVNQTASAAGYNDGAYHHLAVVYNNGTETLYLDGVAVSTRSGLGQFAYNSAYTYFLGTGYSAGWPGGANGWYDFQGTLDETAVYTTALTASQIATHFAVGAGRFDYGNAPSPYPTSAADDGARHIAAGPTLGSTRTSETNGPSSSADNDGVFLPELVAVGGSQAVLSLNHSGGKVDGWIDFNGDGDWDDPGEQVLADVSGSGGYFITVPTDVRSGTTWARFRVTTAGGLTPTGLAADGEVEDYQVVIHGVNLGDAPGYSQAMHGAVGPTLGFLRNESSVSPGGVIDVSPFATDDNDGVDFNIDAIPLVAGRQWYAHVSAPNVGYVNGWIDFNQDGVFSDSEHIVSNAWSFGDSDYSFTMPSDAVLGTTWARFRVSNQYGVGPDGFAPDGEVEDYQVTFIDPATASRDIVVTNTHDRGPGSLRNAIMLANLLPGHDDIRFDIPADQAVGGQYVISVNSPLPGLSESVTIDGRTQTGFAGTPLIRIEGTNIGIYGDDIVFRSLNVQALNIEGSNNAIYGTIVREGGVGIYQGAGNRLGGPGADERNYLAFVAIDGNDDGANNRTYGNIIQGNWIGFGIDGQPVHGGYGGNYGGIGIWQSDENIIGGSNPGEGNWIHSNQHYWDGRFDSVRAIGLFNSDNNIIAGNRINVDSAGQPMFGLDNAIEVSWNSTGNIIGGTEAGAGNVIASDNIAVTGSAVVLGNSIVQGYQGPYAIDSSQAPPELSTPSVLPNGNSRVAGTLEVSPFTSYRIEFFANDAYHLGSAQIYLGFVDLNVTSPDGVGEFTFDYAPIPGFRWITATATRNNSGPTSRISDAVRDDNNSSTTLTNLFLDNRFVDANQDAGAFVGSFFLPNGLDPALHSFELVGGEGDDGNGIFEIVDNRLYANSDLSPYPGDTYSIRVRTTNSDGDSFERIFIIVLTDAPEPLDVAPPPVVPPGVPGEGTIYVAEDVASGTTVEYIGSTTAPLQPTPDGATSVLEDAEPGITIWEFEESGEYEWDGFEPIVAQYTYYTLDDVPVYFDGAMLKLGATLDFETRNVYQFTIYREPIVEFPWYRDYLYDAYTSFEFTFAVADVAEFANLNWSSDGPFSLDYDGSGYFLWYDSNLGILDYETENQHHGEVTLDDGTLWRQYDIRITNVNEPIQQIYLDDNIIPEAVDGSTDYVFGTLSGWDPDGETEFNYSIVSDPSEAFSIDGNQLIVSNPYALDFESNASYAVTIAGYDAAGTSVERTFEITVRNVNEAISSIWLDGDHGDPYSDAGTEIGSIQVSDPDIDETFTYEISGPDSYFAVDEYGTISFASDSVAPGDYVVTIRAFDSHGSSIQSDVTVHVGDTSLPTANDDSYSMSENQQLGIDVLTNDVDPLGGGLTIIDYTNPVHGQLEVGPSGFTYRPGEFYVGRDSFQYTVQDAQGRTATATVTISVVGNLSFTGPSNYDILFGGILYFDASPDPDSTESAELSLQHPNRIPDDANYQVTLTILNYGGTSSIGSDGFGTQQVLNYYGSYDYVVGRLEATHVYNNGFITAQLRLEANAYDAATGDLLATGTETRTITPVSRDRYLQAGLGWYVSEDYHFDFSDSFADVPDPYHSIPYNHRLQIAATDVDASAVVEVRAFLVSPNGLPEGALDDGFGPRTEIVHQGTLTEINEWLASLAFVPPSNFGTFVSGEQVQLWIELAAPSATTGDMQVSRFRRDFTIGPVADVPGISVDSASGSIGSLVPLAVQGQLADTDGSESLWFDLDASDVPAGVELRLAGVALSTASPLYHADLAVWRLPSAQMADLTVYSADPVQFELSIRAVAIESQHLQGPLPGTTPWEATSAFTTMTVAIHGDNSAPTANDDEIGGSEDQPISGNVLDNDSDPDGDSLVVDAQSIDTLNGGHVELQSDGSFVYTPAANYFGSDSFAYVVRDDFGHASQAMVTLSISAVNDSPVLADDAYSGSEDTPITGSVLDNDSDIDGDIIHAVADTIATAQGGVVEMREDGSFAYTPATNFHGEDSFVYQATDGASDWVSATVYLTVASVNDDPIATDDASSGDEDSAISGNVLDNDTDPDGDALSVDADSFDTALGGHVELSADGTFTYTPPADYFGSDSFTYVVRDGNGGSAQATVVLDIQSVNDAPTIVGDAYLGFEDGQIFGNVLDNDFDTEGDTLTVEVGTFATAQGGTVELQTDGSFVYTPAASFHGEDSFVYRATDGIADWTEATVLFSVESVNDAPVAQDDSFEASEDLSLNGNVLDNDSDADGDSLSVVESTIVSDAGVEVEMHADGSFIYSPIANFNGEDRFVYTVSDGNGGYAQATVVITVQPVDDAPVALDDEYFGNEDESISGNVLSNDYDVDSPSLAVAEGAFTTEQGGEIVFSSDGSFVYTPASNFFGDDRFEYSIVAGELQSTANIVFHVASVNDDPVAQDDAFAGDEDSVISDNVLTNDSDADGDTLSVDPDSFDTALGGHVELSADGSFVYTPAANYFGSDSFTYIVRDGNGGAAQATVYLDIAPVNDAPEIIGDAFLGSEDATISGNVLGNDFDFDGDALSVEAGTVETAHGGTVVLQSNGDFVYTPAANFYGEDSFVYRATDGIADWGEGTVILSVESVNDDPVANDDSFQSNEDEPLTGNVLDNDTDADGDTLQTVAGTIATDAGGSVEIFADGSFVFTPPADFHGIDHFVYTATDGNGAYAQANVTIAVASVDDAPVAVDDEYFGDEDQSISGNMLSNDFDVDLDPLFVSAGIFTTEQGGQIDVSSGGSFIYTPAANFFGDDRFVYSAIAGEKQATGAVFFHVASINDDPLALDDAFSGNEDGQIADNALTNDSDADGDTLTVDSQSIDTANGGHLELNSDGSFVYTPAANYFGPDSFTYTVRDGAGGSAQATVTLDVASVNDAPVAVNDDANTDEDSPTTGNVATNDTDADGDMLFVASGTYATDQGGVLEIHSDGSFVYTPAANFHGIDTFQYTIRDASEAFSVGTVTIDVASVNDDPIASPESFEGNEDDPISGNVLTNDSDVDSTTLQTDAGEFLTAAGGRVVLEADGTFAYTPIANFFGDDSFDYVLRDGDGGEAIGTVSLRIAPVNDAPTIVDDSYSGDEDRTITGNVLDNDSDIDGDTLIVDAGTFETAHGGSVVLQSDGSFVYTPAANYFGYDSFVYRVTDSVAEWGQGTATLSIAPVDDAPVATADAFTGDEDSPIAGDVLDNDSDIDGDPLTAIAETVTTDRGISVSISADGTFAYTPPTNYNGFDRFVYRLVNPAGDAISAEVVLTIRPVNDAPVAQDDAFSGNEDTAITGNVLGTDSDVDGDTLAVVPAETVTIGGGRVVIHQDGSFAYAPRTNYNGSDLFTYRIRDGQGGEATATVRLTIAAVNDAPTAVDDLSNGYEDFNLSGNVLINDSDIDGDTLHVQAGTYATEHGGSITFQTNGAFSYLPAANFNGDDHFVYTALDGHGGATQATLTLRLVPLNDLPIANNDTGSGNEDQPITGNVLANDTDADGDNLTVTPITTTTIIGSRIVLLSNGNYVYTPAADFFGQESITYTLSDGHFGTATAVLQFLVAPVNDAPIANNDSVNGVEDSIAFGSVLGNDTDPDGDMLQAQAGTFQTQQGGSVTIQSNGSFAYTPAANFNGDDRFTYTALDGHDGSAQATVTIRVSAVNDNPVATDDAFSGAEDQPIESNLLTNDRDADGDALFATAGTVPTFAGGSVTIQANGNFVYAPASNFNGPDSFTYTISDGHGGTASATVRFTISPVNDPPTVSPAHFTIAENSAQGTLVGFVSANDIDVGQTLRYAILANVDGEFLNPFVIDAATGAIRATQPLNYEAQSSYRFFVRVTDDGSPALSRDAEITIDVMNVNETPTLADDRFTGNQGTPIGGNVLANDTDPDGDALSANPGTIATAQGGSVLLEANGSFLYTPPATFHGEDSFTYASRDAGGLSASATVRLTVRPAPIAADDTYTIDEGRTLRANVRTNDSHPAGTPFTVVPADFVTARGASASIGSDGSLVYVPASAHYDTDEFAYDLIDTNGARAIGHVHIDVRNLPPTALLRQIFDPTAPTLMLSNATDAPEDASRGLHYAFDTDGDGIFDVGGDGTYAGSSTNPTLSLANLPPTTSATRTITARVIDADGGVTDYAVTYQNQGSLVAPSAPPVAVRNAAQQNAVVLNLESFARQLPTGTTTNPQTYSIAYNTTTPTAFDILNLAYTGTGTFEVAMPPNVVGTGGGVVPVLVRVTDTVTGITTDYQFFVVIPPAVLLPASDPVVVSNFDVKSFVGVTTIVKGTEDFGKRNEDSEEDSVATEASSNKIAVVVDVDKAAEVSVVIGNNKAVETVAFDMVLAEPPGPADSIVTYVGPLNNSPLVTSDSDNVRIVIRLLDANLPEPPAHVSNAGLDGAPEGPALLASNTENGSTTESASPTEEQPGGIWGWVRAAIAMAFAASCAGFFLWRRAKQNESKIA
jgi:hypothetical protein